MKTFLATVILCMSCFATDLNAQTEVVFKGEVSIDGEPVIGATVFLDRTSCGTFTDDDGKFSLECKVSDDGPYILSFTYIGQKSVKAEIQSRETAEESIVKINWTSRRKYTVSVEPDVK